MKCQEPQISFREGHDKHAANVNTPSLTGSFHLFIRVILHQNLQSD